MPFGTGISSAVQINVLLPIFYYSAKVAFLSYCDFFFFFPAWKPAGISFPRASALQREFYFCFPFMTYSKYCQEAFLGSCPWLGTVSRI